MRHLAYPRRDLTDMEIGWLAGLYEGEGTAYVNPEKRGDALSTSVRICICMTDRDVIQRVQDLFPSPSPIAERKRKPNEKRQYEWRISQRDLVAEFLTLILPLLGERRREQAHRVLRYATDPDGGLGSGWRKRTHCKHGHEFTPENTATGRCETPGGTCLYRVCKECRRISSRRKRERDRARTTP